MHFGALRGVQVIREIPDERVVFVAFLADGTVTLAFQEWVNIYASPRSGDSADWRAPGEVVAMERAHDGRSVSVAVYGGAAFRLWLDGDSVASEELSPVEAPIRAPQSALQRVGRRPIVIDRGVHIHEPASERRARLLAEDDRLLAATDDGMTIVFERHGHVLIGDVDESLLEWVEAPFDAGR